MKIRWNFQGDFQNVAKIPIVFIVLTKTWTLASYTKKNIIQINHHNHPSSVLTLSIALSFGLFCISGSLKLAAILDWLYTVVAKYQNSAFRIARESLKNHWKCLARNVHVDVCVCMFLDMSIEQFCSFHLSICCGCVWIYVSFLHRIQALSITEMKNIVYSYMKVYIYFCAWRANRRNMYTVCDKYHSESHRNLWANFSDRTTSVTALWSQY